MNKIGIASDHAGFDLKEKIIKSLTAISFEDFGAPDEASVDYPDFAKTLCLALRAKKIEAGILICGSGIGMSIMANRFKGVRAALCLTPQMAQLAREHNDANVLVLGARFLESEEALHIVHTFFKTEFAAGRHAGRVLKLDSEE